MTKRAAPAPAGGAAGGELKHHVRLCIQTKNRSKERKNVECGILFFKAHAYEEIYEIKSKIYI